MALNKNNMTFYDIISDTPSLNITINAGQLLEVIDEAISKKFGNHAEKQTERLLTIEEVCQIAQVSRQTVNRWQRSGVVPYHKIGKAVRFKYSDVMRFLNGGEDR